MRLFVNLLLRFISGRGCPAPSRLILFFYGRKFRVARLREFVGFAVGRGSWAVGGGGRPIGRWTRTVRVRIRTGFNQANYKLQRGSTAIGFAGNHSIRHAEGDFRGRGEYTSNQANLKCN